MQPPYLPYSIALFTAALTSVAIIGFTWRQRRGVSGGGTFIVFMLALTWWSLTYALHWTRLYRPAEFFWLDLTYLGVVAVPACFLVFALGFTQRQRWVKLPLLALLAVEPLITLVLLGTDSSHSLFTAGKRTAGASAILDGGPWFWFNVAYSYFLILIAFLMILQAYQRAPRLYRGQARMILLGSLAPWVSSSVGLLGISPFPNLDLTPIAFTLTGVAFAYGLYHYGLLEIVPVARDLLVENMGDAMLVLDDRDRVVDINPAALQLIDGDREAPIGLPAYLVLAAWPNLITRFEDVTECQEEILVSEAPRRYFDLHITPLAGRDGRLSGRLITLRDITDRKQAELALREANQSLQTQLVEIEDLQAKLREQVIRDPLTGLFNRRYLEVTLQRELAKAERDGTPIGLVMMDIDHFKMFNDSFGHSAGDIMLQALGELLRKYTRSGDVPCRYGGEEFLVVLPGASLADARERSEQWREGFEALRVYSGHELLQTTLSFGISAYPDHGGVGDVLVQAADKALYAAKAAGRNRVVVWPENGSEG